MRRDDQHPALGAAQQTLQQMGIDANGAALSCAVAYPLGVVGVILAVVFLRKLFVRPCDMPGPDAEHRKNVFIASYHLTNPAVFGKSVHEIATRATTISSFRACGATGGFRSPPRTKPYRRTT